MRCLFKVLNTWPALFFIFSPNPRTETEIFLYFSSILKFPSRFPRVLIGEGRRRRWRSWFWWSFRLDSVLSIFYLKQTYYWVKFCMKLYLHVIRVFTKFQSLSPLGFGVILNFQKLLRIVRTYALFQIWCYLP